MSKIYERMQDSKNFKMPRLISCLNSSHLYKKCTFWSLSPYFHEFNLIYNFWKKNETMSNGNESNETKTLRDSNAVAAIKIT